MRHIEDDDPYVVIEKHEGSVGSFLMGLALGAGLAVLLAPHSGRETRRRIRSNAERVGQAAVDVAQDVSGQVVDTFQDARARVEERIDNAREAIEMKKRQVARAMEAGREAAQQARSELERRLAETKAAYQAGAETERPRPPRAGATAKPAGGTVVSRRDPAAAGVTDAGEGGVEL